MACSWPGRLMVELGVSPAGSGAARRRVMLRWPPLRRAVSGTQRAPTRLGAITIRGVRSRTPRLTLPRGPGDRDPVLAVGDVVATLQPVGLNGCQRLSLANRDHQCLKAPAAPLIGGEKVTVKLPVCGARGADDVPVGECGVPERCEARRGWSSRS
jgi:hypothetical protein